MITTFKKAQTWQCAKCNQILALTFKADTPEIDSFGLLLAQHKKSSAECTAPSGFKLINTFMKHEEVKEL